MPSSISSATSIPSSSSVPSLGDPSDRRTTIFGIVLCAIGLITIAIIMVWTYRFKPGPPLNTRSITTITSDDIPPLHPRRARIREAAARIIPFGSEAPRFNHPPGRGMRIAQRAPDGSWQFSESTTSLVPKGITDLDPEASPVSPIRSPNLPSPVPPARTSDPKKIDDWRLTLGLGSDNFEIKSPPAHRQQYISYLDHGKT